MNVLAVMFWSLLTGYFLVRAIARELPLIMQASLGAGIGAGAISLCYFCEMLSGIQSLWFELAVLAVAITVTARQGWRVKVRRSSDAALGPWWLSGTIPLVLAIALAGDLYGFFRQISWFPHGSWDGWAIWNLHAHFLVTSRWRDLFTQTLAWSHPDYPLLVPGFVARVLRFQGDRDLDTPAMLAFLFGFGTVGVLGGAVAALKGRTQGLLAALFLAATPFFFAQAGSEIADVPISFFVLATAALLALQDRVWPDQGGISVLAGVTAGLAAWTKNEGLLLVALVVPLRALAVWYVHGRKTAARQISRLVAGLAVPLATVVFFKLHFATSNGHLGNRSVQAVLSSLADSHRWSVTLAETASGLASFGDLRVGVVWVLACYTALAGFDRTDRRGGWFTGALLLFLILACELLVCVISPFDIQWQMDTALLRLLLQLWPATLFLVFSRTRPISFVTAEPA